jgi:hypothetical protein
MNAGLYDLGAADESCSMGRGFMAKNVVQDTVS